MIYKIDPTRHEFTRKLVELLRGVDVAAASMRLRDIGTWTQPTLPPPAKDRTRPEEQHLFTIDNLTGSVPLDKDRQRRQCMNYYPAGGGIGWHTDSAQPGWRVYVFRLLGVAGEYRHCQFLYDEHVFEEMQEFGGYVFEAGVWHALRAWTPRLVCGFQVSPTFATQVVLGCA